MGLSDTLLEWGQLRPARSTSTACRPVRALRPARVRARARWLPDVAGRGRRGAADRPRAWSPEFAGQRARPDAGAGRGPRRDPARGARHRGVRRPATTRRPPSIRIPLPAAGGFLRAVGFKTVRRASAHAAAAARCSAAPSPGARTSSPRRAAARHDAGAGRLCPARDRVRPAGRDAHDTGRRSRRPAAGTAAAPRPAGLRRRRRGTAARRARPVAWRGQVADSTRTAGIRVSRSSSQVLAWMRPSSRPVRATISRCTRSASRSPMRRTGSRRCRSSTSATPLAAARRSRRRAARCTRSARDVVGEPGPLARRWPLLAGPRVSQVVHPERGEPALQPGGEVPDQSHASASRRAASTPRPVGAAVAGSMTMRLPSRLGPASATADHVAQQLGPAADHAPAELAGARASCPGRRCRRHQAVVALEVAQRRPR